MASISRPTPKAANQSFCRQCGERLGGGRFCGSCGTPSGASGELVINLATGARESTPTIPTQREAIDDGPPQFNLSETAEERHEERAERQRSKLLVAMMLVVVLLIAGGSTALVFLTRHGAVDTFPAQSRTALAPLAAANETFAQQVHQFSKATSLRDAKADVAALASTAIQTRAALATLTVGSSPADRHVKAAADAAIASETNWLTTAAGALAQPAGPMAAQLTSLGLDVASKLDALGSALPGISATFADASTFIEYVDGQARSAQTTVDVRRFIRRIDTLVAQSQTAFTQINEVFGVLSNVANGGFSSMSLAQLEQEVTTVISNRSSQYSPCRKARALLSVACRHRL